MQTGWRYCTTCKALVFSGHGPGPCFGGATHTYPDSDSGYYAVAFESELPTGQAGWRWCSICQMLCFAESGAGACVRNREHDHHLSGPYAVAVQGESTVGQTGWRRCHKCCALYFSESGDGACAGGGVHDARGSDAYVVTFAADTPTDPPQPRLCFWQDLDPHTYPRSRWAVKEDERQGFANLATLQALRIDACAGPRYYGGDGTSIGPAAYRTGKEFIDVIRMAHRGTRRRIERIHVFCHSGLDPDSGAEGLFGEDHTLSLGLYRNEWQEIRQGRREAGTDYDPQNQSRLIKNLPRNALSSRLIVVLHGCKMATIKDSFARQLFLFLNTGRTMLPHVRVFAHRDSAAGEQDTDWIEYSHKHPDGRATLMDPQIYRRFTDLDQINTVARFNRENLTR